MIFCFDKRLQNLSSALVGIWIVLLSFLFLCPAAYCKTMAELNHQLNQITPRIENLSKAIASNQLAIKEINQFAGLATGWFTAVNDMDSKIAQIKREMNTPRWQNLNSGARKSLQDELLQEQTERQKLYQLNGKPIVSYSGFACSTIDQLREEYQKASTYLKEIENKNIQLENELAPLRDERMNILRTVTATGMISGELMHHKNKELELAKKKLERYREIAFSPGSLWIMNYVLDKKIFPPIQTVHRNLVISAITRAYIDELRMNGTPYNPKELASRIRNIEEDAILARQYVKDHLIKEEEARISELSRELETLDRGLDFVGCWRLENAFTFSTIKIIPLAGGVFRGILQIDNLKDYKSGDVLFDVKRSQNKHLSYIFTGKEYSYSATSGGKKMTTTPLRIILFRSYLQYHTGDDFLKMTRCQ